MRIQLVNAPMKKSNNIGGEIVTAMWPPYALMCLGAYLDERWREEDNAGAPPEIRIVDGMLKGYEETRQKILAYKPRILGISFLTPNATGAFDLINEIREALPHTLIVCGGVHATAMPEEVFDRSGTDIVVLGEGEETFYQIVKARSMGGEYFDHIRGIAFMNGGDLVKNEPRAPLCLDDLPLPGPDHIEEPESYKGFRFKKTRRELLVMSTRGCPFD